MYISIKFVFKKIFQNLNKKKFFFKTYTALSAQSNRSDSNFIDKKLSRLQTLK